MNVLSACDIKNVTNYFYYEIQLKGTENMIGPETETSVCPSRYHSSKKFYFLLPADIDVRITFYLRSV